MMNKAILLQSDNIEGLFINGELVQQNYLLNKNRVEYFIKLSKQFNFNIKDMKKLPITERDNKSILAHGGFPELLILLEGNYEN